MNDQLDFLGFGNNRALHEAIRDRYNDLRDRGLITHSVDTLPHTEDEKLVHRPILNAFVDVTENQVHCILMNWRKRGECQAPSSCQR